MKKVKLISTRGKIEVGCQDHLTREAGTMVERTLSTASHIWFLSAFAALIQLLPRQGVTAYRSSSKRAPKVGVTDVCEARRAAACQRALCMRCMLGPEIGVIECD